MIERNAGQCKFVLANFLGLCFTTSILRVYDVFSQKKLFQTVIIRCVLKKQLFENQFYERILEFFHNFEQKNTQVSKNGVF